MHRISSSQPREFLPRSVSRSPTRALFIRPHSPQMSPSKRFSLASDDLNLNFDYSKDTNDPHFLRRTHSTSRVDGGCFEGGGRVGRAERRSLLPDLCQVSTPSYQELLKYKHFEREAGIMDADKFRKSYTPSRSSRSPSVMHYPDLSPLRSHTRLYFNEVESHQQPRPTHSRLRHTPSLEDFGRNLRRVTSMSRLESGVSRPRKRALSFSASRRGSARAYSPTRPYIMVKEYSPVFVQTPLTSQYQTQVDHSAYFDHPTFHHDPIEHISTHQQTLDCSDINRSDELTSFVLSPGEHFTPNDISVSYLPSGQKATTYTSFEQSGVGNKAEADREIHRVVKETEILQKRLRTLEDFVRENRSLFPEDLLIYQRIVFRKLTGEELRARGEKETEDMYAVEVHERLVVPIGSDVTSALRRFKSCSRNVEVEYQERDYIRKQFKDAANTDDSKVKRTKVRADLNQSDYYLPKYPDRYRFPSKGHHICDDEESPSFTSRLRSQKVMEGHSVRLTCSVAGSPMPRVSWYKNNVQLPVNQGGRFTATTDYGLCCLEMCRVCAEDAGEYRCEISNEFGSTNSSAQLTVDGRHDSIFYKSYLGQPPTFITDAKDLRIEQGNTACFEVQVGGKPLPLITWSKDGEFISDSGRFRTLDDGQGNHRLVISDVKYSDAGVYTCSIDNKHGGSTSAARLAITSPVRSSSPLIYPPSNGPNYWEYEPILALKHAAPSFLETSKEEVEVVEGQPLTLRCTADGYPFPKVRWYKGQVELLRCFEVRVTSHRAAHKTDVIDHVMQILKTKMADGGEYRAVASNPVGHASKIFRVTIIPDFPKSQLPKPDLLPTEYTLVKKTKIVKTAPYFVVKLPQEAKLKLGCSVRMGCAVEEAFAREKILGFELVPDSQIEDDARLIRQADFENIPQMAY